jgi:hypothetical protein
VAARLTGQQGARLPKRCPSCGGPVYPDEARCSRCGADPVATALAEASTVPQDADGHDLPDVARWGLSGPRFRDLLPGKYRPVYDVILIIIASIVFMGAFLLLLFVDPPVYVFIVLIIAIIVYIIAIILSIISITLLLLFGDRRLYDSVVPVIATIGLITSVILDLVGFVLELFF